MTSKILASVLLASGLLALTQGGAQARIVCDGNFQIVHGQPVGTPYCREMNLAHVARTYGWHVTDEAIRYSESTKAQVCRAIGYDNRVQDICAPYQPYGGDGRFHF
ncbi:MAG: hypothetical protein J2P50_17190 [Hyphomicrobiaceae bacterium]|nr:hypothetical protein [Hyphomicrobiaceae bacterium]